MLSDKDLRLLNRIQRKTLYENKFFEARTELKWFDELEKRGYFNPNPDTEPQKAELEGHFCIPQWNVLPYLEKISQQVSESENEKYIEKLLAIICNITEYHIKNDKALDNYRTWWYFVKILCNIPNDKISIDIIELIPIWLKSKFDNSLPGSEILKKLLPKFLDSNDSKNREKAEKIIEIVTAVDLDREEPRTIIDPYWLSESLRKNATKIAQICGMDVVFNIADNLKQTFRKKYGSAHPTIDFQGNRYMMSIDYTTNTNYTVIIVLEKAVLKQTWEGKFDFAINDIQNKTGFIRTIRKNLRKNDAFKELKDELDSELDFIYEKIPQDFSFLWADDLIFDIKRSKDEPEAALTAVLRDILFEKAKIADNLNAIKDVFTKFFGVEYRYPIFRRIAFYIIGKLWNSFKKFFWNIMKTAEGEALFSDSVFEPELYNLLKINVSEFEGELKENIENIKIIIDRGPQGKNYTEIQKAYWKQKWYSAMKDNSFFKPFYIEQQKITHIEEEVELKSTKTRFGPGPSPLSIEEIIKMDNRKLASYLKEFKTKDYWHGPTVDGLAETLKAVVKTNSGKFTQDIDPFETTAYYYVYHILWGIREAWQDKNDINWGTLFGFIIQYVRQDGFWEDKYLIADDHWHADHLWVIGVIGELITQGTRDDAWAYSDQHFQASFEVINVILEKMYQEKEQIYNNHPLSPNLWTYSLNSVFGKITEALFMLAIRIKRVEEKTKQQSINWDRNIKSQYDEILKNEIIEGYFWLGFYLLNFNYLDTKWTTEKMKILIDDPNWQAFMTGYLVKGKVYPDLYESMESHYKKATGYDFKEIEAKRKLVEHICIGYLREKEDFAEDSLFGKILMKWNPEQIIKIIGFFWMQRDYERKPRKSIVAYHKNGEIKHKEIAHKTEIQHPEDDETNRIYKRIISFWQWVYNNKYKTINNLSGDDKKILSELTKLTVFLPEINVESYDWLMISVPYVDVRVSAFFIEYLNDLKETEQSITYIGKIFLEMLEGSTPDYDEEHIKSIVEYMFIYDDKEIKGEAKKICNIYGSRGYNFLRKICEQNANV